MQLLGVTSPEASVVSRLEDVCKDKKVPRNRTSLNFKRSKSLKLSYSKNVLHSATQKVNLEIAQRGGSMMPYQNSVHEDFRWRKSSVANRRRCDFRKTPRRCRPPWNRVMTLVGALRLIVLMLNSTTDLLSTPAHNPFTNTDLNSNLTWLTYCRCQHFGADILEVWRTQHEKDVRVRSHVRIVKKFVEALQDTCHCCYGVLRLALQLWRQLREESVQCFL